MVLLIAIGLALWLGACVVAVTLCMAAARGDRALSAAETLPARPETPDVAAPLGERRRRVA